VPIETKEREAEPPQAARKRRERREQVNFML
jgi:hypothetical protein